jgi:hypothetical protein
MQRILVITAPIMLVHTRSQIAAFIMPDKTIPNTISAASSTCNTNVSVLTALDISRLATSLASTPSSLEKQMRFLFQPLQVPSEEF